MAHPVHIVVFYAHKDARLKDKLIEHLSLLKQQGIIALWTDQDICAGMDWQHTTREQIDTAQLILLLISPAFLASEHCYGQDMVRAVARHRQGKACLIPILLRPVDWRDAPFGNLQPLPHSGQPITLLRQSDRAFYEIAQHLRTIAEDIQSGQQVAFPLNQPEMPPSVPVSLDEVQYQLEKEAYWKTLFATYKMLDFRGILHIDAHRSLSIPLLEVFVFPDVLKGVPAYETVEREEEALSLGHSSRLRRRSLERESFLSVLSTHSRLVILGDPGSGKSTLLRYLLLQMTHEDPSEAFPFSEEIGLIPLYIPLASYAEVVSAHLPGNRSLYDFLSISLRDHYLDAFYPMLQYFMQIGKVCFLFDGLDEIPDTALRTTVVQHLERFTQAQAHNRFLVTSRIIGYKDAPLSSLYQAYTLADFDEEQIQLFTQKWCPAYERWVNDVHENDLLEHAATQEAEKLFDATQSQPGVKRLAVNPLLLTILALIQRQGIDLPSHRVELFDLCALTLLDTWVKAKGHTMRLSRTDLIRMLRPLAFWMHHHRAVGAIPEEELFDTIVEELLKRTYRPHEATSMAEQFLQTVRSRTGILVERGKARYGFLHLTFEEYFAALELEKRKDRDTFIAAHMHHPRWREVIRLTVGTIGILRSNEEAVTELVCDVIARAESPYEWALHRDLLFAGTCLADDVGVRPHSEEQIIEQVVYHYLTTELGSPLSRACSAAVQGWRGITIADKAAHLIFPLLQNWIRDRNPFSSTALTSFEAQLQNALQEQKTAYQHLLAHWFTFDMTILLAHLNRLEGYDWTDTFLTLLSDEQLRSKAQTLIASANDPQKLVVNLCDVMLTGSESVMQIKALQARGYIGSCDQSLLEKIVSCLCDENERMQRTALHVIQQLKISEDNVLRAVLNLVYVPGIIPYAIETLCCIGLENTLVVDVLLEALVHIDSVSVRIVATPVLSRLQYIDAFTIDWLLSALKGENDQITEGLVDLLCQISQNAEHIRKVLCSAFVYQTLVQEIVIGILGFADPHRQDITEALLSSYSTSSSTLKEVILNALGLRKANQPEVITLYKGALKSSSWIVRREAIRAFEQAREVPSEVVDSLLKNLPNTDRAFKCTILQTLSMLAPIDVRVQNSLLLAALDPELAVNRSAMSILCEIGKKYPQQMSRLLAVSTQAHSQIYRDEAIKQYQSRQYQILITRTLELLANLRESSPATIDLLCSFAEDESSEIRRQTARTLGQLGKKDPATITQLLSLLSNAKKTSRILIFEAFGFLEKSTDTLVEVLLVALNEPYASVREYAALALGHAKERNQEVTNALLCVCNDSNIQVRIAAIRSLGIQNVQQIAVIDYLTKALSDQDASIRLFASLALANVRKPQSHMLDALFQALLSSSTIGRQGASLALRVLGKDQSAFVDRLHHILVNPDVAAYVKADVAFTIGALGDKRPPILEALVQVASDRYYPLRAQALVALGNLQEKQPPIIQCLITALTDTSSRVRRASIQSIVELGVSSEVVVDLFFYTLTDDISPQVRTEAAYALARLQADQRLLLPAIETLLKQCSSVAYYDDPQSSDRLYAALQKAVE